MFHIGEWGNGDSVHPGLLLLLLLRADGQIPGKIVTLGKYWKGPKIKRCSGSTFQNASWCSLPNNDKYEAMHPEREDGAILIVTIW